MKDVLHYLNFQPSTSRSMELSFHKDYLRKQEIIMPLWNDKSSCAETDDELSDYSASFYYNTSDDDDDLWYSNSQRTFRSTVVFVVSQFCGLTVHSDLRIRLHCGMCIHTVKIRSRDPCFSLEYLVHLLQLHSTELALSSIVSSEKGPRGLFTERLKLYPGYKR